MTREQLNALYHFVISAARYATVDGDPRVDPELRGNIQFSQVRAMGDMERLFLDPQSISSAEPTK